MSHLVLCDKVVSYSGNLLRIEPKSVHKKRIIGIKIKNAICNHFNSFYECIEC